MSRLPVLAAFLAVLVACGGPPAPESSAAPRTPTPGTPTADPATPRSGFVGTAAPLSAAQRGRMTPTSWRPGCPVGLDDLRLVKVSHRDAAGKTRRGTLIAHSDVTDDLIEAFRQIFEARFPIAKMVPVDEYGGDDDRSMLDNNTSAFNCRRIDGSSRWSQHSYGRAVDTNPFKNPWVKGNSVDPPEAAAYADRSRGDPQMIRRGDAVWTAFRSVGWGWGGDWQGSKDYQHFSATGGLASGRDEREGTDGGPQGIGPQHVLVVEDDDSISKLLKIILEQNGYIVKVVNNYVAATGAIQESEPSLIMLDIGLPDGNGLDLPRWVRDALGSSVPIVVLSAFRQEDNVGRAFELGANDFVPKPFRPKELMARVQRVLAQ